MKCLSLGSLYISLFLAAGSLFAADYHVSVSGADSNKGGEADPFRTISAAAEVAMPGDTVIVHNGIYRERINPPRGGNSETNRIVYRSHPGDKVVIKGSEVIKGWKKVANDTWRVDVPGSFFGTFNPFSDLIRGDWFTPRGRKHHTGAVYLNGHWLTEAASQKAVMAPAGKSPLWFAVAGKGDSLLNVAWLQPAKRADKRQPASGYSAHGGIRKAAMSNGGQCIGYIEDCDWARYDNIDFGTKTKELTLLASSKYRGGHIEVRLNDRNGDLLGVCDVTGTGGWKSWKTFSVAIKPLSGVQPICLVFKNRNQDSCMTTIWAQFKDVDPNEENVEINVRQTVFYPEKPGINYITVRGFKMEHAATPWAPPTAEQIGLIGTHWSKGWIIENNAIRYSTCVGVTLGKYGDKWDNTSADSAVGYVKTIERAEKEAGWSKENIGHHIVRGNHISHCEQAGIVGSLGAIFSEITGNTVHDIHIRRLFSGHEQAGIKIHAPIDMLIKGNHVYRCDKGMWLDWMTQGTRVTGNLMHDNTTRDLYVEVNHGPCVVDNNVMLSKVALWNASQGVCYAHNLIAGDVYFRPQGRKTPYHLEHSTKIAGLSAIQCGDDRFYNNIFAAGKGFAEAKSARHPMFADGNVYFRGVTPCSDDKNALVYEEFDPKLKLTSQGFDVYGFNISMTLPKGLDSVERKLVKTEMLGKAKIPDLPFMDYDGKKLEIKTDYFGLSRDVDNPSAGPFEGKTEGDAQLRLW